MGIFSRLTDIVNSNLTALLDRAEDPEKMVRLIIQEMEETLVEVRTASARAIADRKTLQRRRQRLEAEVAEWQRKAEVALQREREDLARGALLERNQVQADLQAVAQEQAVLDDSIARLTDDVGQLEAKLQDARSRQQSLVQRNLTARTQWDVRKRFDDKRIGVAMGRFEQYERRIDDLEGQVEAHDLKGRTLAEEIAALEEDEQLEQELAALRSRLREQDETPR